MKPESDLDVQDNPFFKIQNFYLIYMVKRTATLIHKLRVYFLLFIAVGFFYQIGLDPVDVGKFVGSNIGSAVGMNVSIPENPINKLALQLQEKEDALNAREQALSAREQELGIDQGSNQNLLLMILGVGIVVLFILVIINYYLDYKRRNNNAKTINKTS